MNFHQLLHASDDELIKLAKQYNVILTKSEIKALRPILQRASFHWLIVGIPANERKKIASIIGSERLRQLEKMLTT